MYTGFEDMDALPEDWSTFFWNDSWLHVWRISFLFGFIFMYDFWVLFVWFYDFTACFVCLRALNHKIYNHIYGSTSWQLSLGELGPGGWYVFLVSRGMFVWAIESCDRQDCS
jgi:hypothetical protein